MTKIDVHQTDITKLKVDAIVNAANSSLLGGGGVDKAIHNAAGPELLTETRALNGCPTGEARITKGYRLPAKHVIHTVGPIWQDGKHNEDLLLESCYLESLKLALDNKCTSIAFPNISTGVYGFPKERAASIAVNSVTEFLKDNGQIERVIFATFDEENYKLYKELLKKVES